MEKFDKNIAFEQMMNLMTEIQKTQGIVNQNMQYITDIPNFLESIYSIGKSDGIKIGKRIKIEDITKQN